MTLQKTPPAQGGLIALKNFLSVRYICTGLLTSTLTACALFHGINNGEEAASGSHSGVEINYRPEMSNSAVGLSAPYVILISIDGYRADYNELFKPKNLLEIATQGVSAEALLPVYPSKTFPNHYSIVTGLYPEHHGIVSNEFLDPKRGASYALSDRASVEDGSWYLGEPLWTTIEKQGVMTASCFWVGSEAAIQGSHPNYYYNYDKAMSNETRVQKVLAWLKLPAEKRPHFITLYFDSVDLAGHQSGPISDAVRDAVTDVDRAIGQLRAAVADTNLAVDLVFVSDHGMEALDPLKKILLDDIIDVGPLLERFLVYGKGPQIILYLKPGQPAESVGDLQKALLKLPSHFRALRRDQMQALHYSASDRIGDLVIIPEAPYVMGTKANPPSVKGGNHGWDVKTSKNMRGIFYATGPDFKNHFHLPAFENINVQPLILQMLGLKQTLISDGKLSITSRALVKKKKHAKKKKNDKK
jgi:predicted AlkP superfamily pyrophosphatase or phosphodiesterase